MAKVGRSDAGRLASERADAAAKSFVEGCPIYPNNTVFVAADLEGMGDVLLRIALERRPVLIVWGDGQERLLIPSSRLDAHWTARLRNRLRRAWWSVGRISARRRPAGPRTAAP